MDFQRDELWRILESKGWVIEFIYNYDFQGWSKETWLLRSTWSRQGATAYLSFLRDPLESTREKFVVWAVGLYSESLLYGVRDEFTIPLNHWRDYLPDFLQTLEKLRQTT